MRLSASIVLLYLLAAQSSETQHHDGASFWREAVVGPVFSLSVVASMRRTYKVDYFGCDYCADGDLIRLKTNLTTISEGRVTHK